LIGHVTPAELFPALQAILHEHQVEFLVAPYSAHAQVLVLTFTTDNPILTQNSLVTLPISAVIALAPSQALLSCFSLDAVKSSPRGTSKKENFNTLGARNASRT